MSKNKQEKMNDDVYDPFGPRSKRWKAGSNPKLSQVSLYMLEQDIGLIESLIKMGVQVNRSEAIRNYVRNGIERDMKLITLKKRIKNLTFDELGTIKEKRALYKELQEYFGDDH